MREMPELPEVETIRQGLSQELVGQTIVSVNVRLPKLFFGDVRSLIGQEIMEISRRAKILIWKLSKNYLAIHLKMTGQLIYLPKDNSYLVGGGHPDKLYTNNLPHQYSHIIFEFDKGKLYFNDLRQFGWIKALNDEDELKKVVEDFGPEYTWPEFTLDYLTNALAKRSITIKQALLDQSLVAGLGNIYVDETLFCAKIHPKQKANKLSSPQIKKIFDCVPKVLNLALKHGGSSSRDYRKTDGSMGTYLVVANVYHRQGLPCKVCGTPIERIKIAGRSSHFCPNCQKPDPSQPNLL